MKRFELFERNDEEYIIDMEYALGYNDPNVDFLEFLGQALTYEEIVNELNKFNECKDYLINYLVNEIQLTSNNIKKLHELSLNDVFTNPIMNEYLTRCRERNDTLRNVLKIVRGCYNE